jgi:hypothetical protein
MSYQRLTEEAERPQQVRDWTARWAKLAPLSSVNGNLREGVDAFCASKRITLAGLEALGARISVDKKNGGVSLAFAGIGPTGAVTAIKYRPLDGSSHDSWTEKPSVWLRSIIAGQRDSLDWCVVEGETDGARLYDLVGDRAAVLVLPSGALAFRPDWAAPIPRGATVALCHDADADGDAGAKKAAAIIGGKTIRVRPPEGAKDWCAWEGGREEFLQLAAAAREPRGVFLALDAFLAHPFPKADPLLGERGRVYLARGSLFMPYGSDGAGKSTWTVDGIAHLASGVDWLGIPVPRPVLFCIIENEGPPDLFQQKLEAKVESWEGPDFTANVFVYTSPWGEFSFADPADRADLVAFCEEHNIDCVTANPTLGLGVAASGRPNETQEFVDWLVECGLKSKRAFWLLHHENKGGQISGDWGRHPDTKVLLQKDGNRQRTKLDWDKTRFATLTEEEKSYMLEWVVETQGYEVVPLDAAGVSEDELDERLDAYLSEHPFTATGKVLKVVKGTNARLLERLKTSPKYDSVKRENAVCWFLAGENVSSAETERSEP